MSGQTDKNIHGSLNRSDSDPVPLGMSNLSKSPSGNNRVYLHGSSSVAQPSTSVSVPNRRVVHAHSPENKGKIQSNVQSFDKY